MLSVWSRKGRTPSQRTHERASLSVALLESLHASQEEKEIIVPEIKYSSREKKAFRRIGGVILCVAFFLCFLWFNAKLAIILSVFGLGVDLKITGEE